MTVHVAAWLILRLAMTWLFLTPVFGLIRDWDGTKQLIRLISPVWINGLAVCCVAIMIAGSLSVLLGVYAQIGAALLGVYCLLGIRVHYQLAKTIAQSTHPGDGDALGIAGHVSSGQKNVVLAAVCLFIVVFGSGPMSLTLPLW